jgi:PAS domain S-box-containing protein
MSIRIRVLHLEDDPIDAELIRTSLRAEGLSCKITRVETRAEFERALRKGEIDLILSDYSLPTYDGVSALRMSMRLRPEVPVVMVSGTRGEGAAVECLTLGAIDYVTKGDLRHLAQVIRRAMVDAADLRNRGKAGREVTLMGYGLDNMHEAAILLDETALIRSVNKEACALLGYTQTELLRLTITDIVPDFSMDRWIAHWKDLSAQKSTTFETRVKAKDLTILNVEANAGLVQYHMNSYVLWLARDTTERKAAEVSLLRLNRELRAVSKCNQALLRSEREEDLLNEICRIVCEDAGYRFAWVGYAEDDLEKTVRPMASFGFDSEYIAGARITWAEGTERGRGAAGTAIRTGQSVSIQDLAQDPRMSPWRERALQHGYRSGLALPLKDEAGKVFGTLAMYSTEVNAFTSDEVRLMEDLSRDLSFGVSVLRTREERRRSVEQLGQRHRELQETYQELEQSRNMLRQIIESIPTRVFWKDHTSRYLGCNTLFAQDAGFGSPDELVDKEDFEMSWRAHADSYRADDQYVMKSGNPKLNILEPLTTKGGDTLWVNTSKVPLRRSNGEIFGVLGIYEDISFRKQAEERLKKLSHVVEQSPVSVVVTDTLGLIEYVNPKFSEVTGYSHEDAQGRNPRILKSGLMAPEVYSDLWNTITSGRDWRGELCNKRKDGGVYWELAVISPMVDPQGKTTNYIAIKEDITSRKNMEEELRASNRVKETLLREVHHRVKNNLQIITSLLSLEAAKYKDPSVLEACDISQRRVRAIAQVHERLVATENIAEIDFGEQLIQLSMELRGCYGRKGIEIEFDVASIEFPIDLAVPCGLIANELVTNALKHAFPGNQTGTISVRLRCIDSTKVELTISDNGIGANPTSGDVETATLGLRLVRSLADQISASISVDTSHGSRVTLEIPYHGDKACSK